MGLGLMGKDGKSKNLALKDIEKEINDSEDEDESKYEDENDDKDEDLTFIANKIIKFLQFRKKDKDKLPRKSKSSWKGKSEKPLILCHECNGFGHMRIKCLNYIMKEKAKKSKDKGLVATWSDTENDSSDEYMDEYGHLMAFAATTDKVIMESASDSVDSFDDEVPKKLTLLEAYDKLCTEIIKSKKLLIFIEKSLMRYKLKKLIY
ncbi:uncharacterized protein LOC136067085 [Quercus suber]|uniref:uncharacterized protein LOC136067085 n=1 Tax=Quercus suber TaxID=58331 RepID=UPI0032DF8F35